MAIIQKNLKYAVISAATAIQKALDYRARRIIVKINNIDRTNLISFIAGKTILYLEVYNNLYSKADTCYFTYEKFGSRTYVPAGGDEIGVWDRGIKIFGGKIINVKVGIEGKVLIYDVECKDWVDQLDGKLVSETYENQTVNQIIADLKSKYAATFDISNVSCTTNIEAIYFDMKPMSKCLDELAEIAGYHWYVDPDKKIYFFAEGSLTSPFDITDTNGKCISESLDIKEDYEQIKNRVNILGGKISNVQVHDQPSIDDYGEHEVVIRDDTLTSTDEALQKANAVLAAFKDPIKEGSFKTYDAGLVAGQRININSALRGVNQDFIIQSVGCRVRTPTDFIYDVQVMTQQGQELIDLFEQEIMRPPPVVEESFGNRDFVCNIKFTIVNYHKVEWEEGHIIMSSGEDYTIAAGNREFTNAEVWYFRPSVSETTLQFSTSFGDGVGEDRVALGYAIPNPNTAKGAQFIPKGFMGGVRFWGGENIVARTIIAGQIAFDSIAGDEISIQTKLAIHDRTFGNKGIQLDYNAGIPRAYIGDGANKYFKYDGVNISWKAQNTELDVSGNLTMSAGGSITGAIIQTATLGKRIRLSSSPQNKIEFLDSAAVIGTLEIKYNATDGYSLFLGGTDGALEIRTIVGASVLAYASFPGYVYVGKASVGVVTITGSPNYPRAFGLEWTGGGEATFSLNLGSGLAKISSNLVPSGAYDLGISGNKWQHLRLSGNVYVDGAINVGGNIRPVYDNTTFFGTPDLGFKSFYFTDAYDPKIYRGSSIQLEMTASNIEIHRHLVTKTFSPPSATDLNIGSAGQYFNEVHCKSVVDHTPKVFVKGLSLLETIQAKADGKVDEVKLSASFRHKKGGILIHNIVMANTAAIKELNNRLKKLE